MVGELVTHKKRDRVGECESERVRKTQGVRKRGEIEKEGEGRGKDNLKGCIK